MKWTTQQVEAIQTTGVSLLVSAAAGSGKTAVLAERCAYLVCDAPQKCDVDELLVVTFTRAAAAEMRARIEQALRRRADTSQDSRLTRQLMLLNRAHITTLHGFCAAFLRRHFHELGIDPNFHMLDEEEVALLRIETARGILDRRYETDTDGRFQRFVDQYGNGNDQGIIGRVLHLADLMCSVVDPDNWMKNVNRRIEQAIGAKRLIDSELGAELAKSVGDWLDDLSRRWVQLAGQISKIAGLEAYGEYVNDLIAAVGCMKQTFGDGNFDGLAREIASLDFGRLPGIRNGPAEQESVKESIDVIRKEMKSGQIADLSLFTEQQWRDGLQRISEPTQLLVELVVEFQDRFATAKHELRGLDFADMERLVLRVLRDKSKPGIAPSRVAMEYQSQFKHVLIDEFQDINEVQDAILSLLSTGSNQFAVGDVKQSIYRFRLAQPRRFLERYELFKTGAGDLSGKIIDLGANFRSRGHLLNVINSVFERLMCREAVEIEYDESHRLKAGVDYPANAAGPVELHLLPPPPRAAQGDDESTELELDRTEREAAFVARRISELVSGGAQVAEKTPDGSMRLRPIRYRDIVILMRALKYKSEQFAQLLRGHDIPVHCESGTGYFESMEIRDMRSLLRVLDNQQQDIPLAAVLRSPLSGLAEPEDCLARIRLAYPDAEEVPFHHAVVLYVKDQKDELAAQLRALLGKIAEWCRLAHQRPLAETLWRIYDQSGYLAFCAGMSDGRQRVANLIDFHERARVFGSFQRQGLGRFMRFLETLSDQQDPGQPSIASEADDVVRVMSIHRSKGLEFPVVFLPDLGKQHNLQDTAGAILVDRDAGIGLMVTDEQKRIRYPSLAYAIAQNRIRRQTLAEEMRVLYVAMTRAREHLILVGTCSEQSPQRWIDDWSSHSGRIPTQRILGGRTMLDWIGPASAAMAGAKLKDRIEMTWHPEEEIEQWIAAARKRAGLSQDRTRLADLEPLDPAPPMHPDAKRVKDRLTIDYPYRAFTTLRAAESVGTLTKQTPSGNPGRSPSSEPADLPLPKFMIVRASATPAEIGSATHLVLEHLDFSSPCDHEDIARQITRLVERRLLSPALAETVDVEAILWFVSTPPGLLARSRNDSLRREVSVFYPLSDVNLPPASAMDRVMVRGRIDLLIPDGDGWTLVDFKTDRVTAQTIDARADFYRPQLTCYREAITAITGAPVRSAYVVFLAVRDLRSV